MLKRLFDIISSSVGLCLLSPFFILLILIISIGSAGGPFYIQTRVGRNERTFGLIKFRSMRKNADESGELTIGRDPRITGIGRFIRRFKLDELPQLINVIIGQMSIVGPRPEVLKYVGLYSEDQRKVLGVRPGLTDYASLEYINEDEILGESDNPEETYIQDIMPAKLELNLKYLKEQSFWVDIRIIFRTIGKIFK